MKGSDDRLVTEALVILNAYFSDSKQGLEFLSTIKQVLVSMTNRLKSFDCPQ